MVNKFLLVKESVMIIIILKQHNLSAIKNFFLFYNNQKFIGNLGI